MENLTDTQIQEIIKDICQKEKETHNLDVEVFVITPIRFYKKGLKKIINSDASLPSKAFGLALPLIAAGAHAKGSKQDQNSILIFLHGRIKKVSRTLYHIINTTYHEIWHEIQTTFEKYSYNGFTYDIDTLLRLQSNNDYLIEHAKYSFEIGAHLYATEKTKEYLQKNYPEIYEQEKEYIEAEIQKNKFYYMTYDLTDNIELMINTLKLFLRKEAKKNTEKDDGPDEISNLEEISPIIPIFLNKDLSFKKISEIMSHEKYKELDKRIVYAFLTSKTFLETINLDTLSDEELNLFYEALNYTNTVYLNQIQQLRQEKNINLKAFLQQEKNILKKYSRICNYYMKKLSHKLNAQRNDEKKEEHMKSIPTYLEKTETIINQRSKRGYITIDIFYIVGLLLSISTIIYLLVK